MLPLSSNYRSHTGIQAIASILMDLLYTGTEIQYSHDSLISKLIYLSAFPEQVDKLPFEIGDQIGPIPTLCGKSTILLSVHY